MSGQVNHPGIHLLKMLDERSLSQREFASKIDIAHSLLNNILKGNRSINVNIALSLEAAGFEDASYWLTKQVEYTLYLAKNDKGLSKKKETIKAWNDLSGIIPISFLKKQKFLGIESSDDIDKIDNVFEVDNFKKLESEIKNFNPTYFRKSSKFSESRNNVFTWSKLAEFKAKQEKVKTFDPRKEHLLINELKKCFYRNEDPINESKSILNRYGIKFFILDRPSKTPVDGKSFMSGDNPAIVLSLKYKRLDNFAFTLLHELGHVFKHLTNPKYNKMDFFVNSSSTAFEEFEANTYAREKLIDSITWDDFISHNDAFSDEVIIKLSNKIKVHPGIIRGRVCFEFPEYYRKRTTITESNKILVD
jgi:HTH-type transcriptional regulator/antitoxin HigA